MNRLSSDRMHNQIYISNRRFDNMPNIFSQSGMNFENYDGYGDGGGKPAIPRPPPRHPGVQLPGIDVPPNAGNIQDIIGQPPLTNIQQVSPQNNDIRRYTTQDGKYTLIHDYRPPIGSNEHNYNPGGSYLPPGQPNKANYQPEPAYSPPKPAYTPPQPSYTPPKPSYTPEHEQHIPIIFDAEPPKYPGDVPYDDHDYNQGPYHQQPNDYKPPPSTGYNRPAPQPQPEPYKPQPPHKPDHYAPPPAPYTPPKLYPAPLNYSPSPVQPTYTTPAAPPSQYSPPHSTNYGHQQDYTYTQPSAPDYPPQNYRPTKAPYNPNPSNYLEPNYGPPQSYTTETVVPPVYNQDFYTPDPNQNFPGPEIYDNNSVQGPSPNNNYFHDKVDNDDYNNNGYNNNNNGYGYSANENDYSHTNNNNQQNYDKYNNNNQNGGNKQQSYDIYDNIKPQSYDKYNKNKYQPYDNNKQQYDGNKQQAYDKYDQNQQQMYDKYDQNQQQIYDKYDNNRYEEVATKVSTYQPPPKRPNGPDYTSSTTLLQNTNSVVRDSIPMRVGIDLYPMTDEGLTGKYGTFGLTGDNKHEVLLHLNLYSKKPDNFGGRQENLEISHSFGPFSLGR